MDKYTIKDFAMVISDGDRSLVITNIPIVIAQYEKEMAKIAEGISVKTFFDDGPHRLFCHIFSNVDLISYDMLTHEDHVIGAAIRYPGDKKTE